MITIFAKRTEAKEWEKINIASTKKNNNNGIKNLIIIEENKNKTHKIIIQEIVQGVYNILNTSDEENIFVRSISKHIIPEKLITPQSFSELAEEHITERKIHMLLKK